VTCKLCLHQLDKVITEATRFDYCSVIFRPILSIASKDAMHTLGSHRVYIHGIHQIKSFVSKGVNCKLCLHQLDKVITEATCFDYCSVIFRTILSTVSQDAIHTLESHRVYIHGIYQIKSFVCKGVTCKLCLQQWDT